MPTIVPNTIPSLCSILPRPHLMTGFFRDWFQKHFGDSQNIEAPELRGLLWQAVREAGQCQNILIDSVTRWNPADTEKRPAILIGRNDWEVVRAGIDDRRQGDVALSGSKLYTCFVKGSHTLFCLGTNGTAAEILSAEVYREMMQFGPAIRQRLDLMRFQVVGVGALFQVEESAEHFAVPVTVAYAAREDWELRPSAPAVKTIGLSLFLP